MTTLKRLILSLLTVLAVLSLGQDLLSSWNKPQIQNRLEIYQANLLLHASELRDNSSPVGNLPDFSNNLRQQADRSLQESHNQLETNFKSSLEELEKAAQVNNNLVDNERLSILAKQVDHYRSWLDDLDLNLGIIKADLNQNDAAIKLWQAVIDRPGYQANNLIISDGKSLRTPKVKTAGVLIGIWSNSPRLLPNADSFIQKNLDGWFRYKALSRLYQLQERQEALNTLTIAEQKLAQTAAFKLAIINVMPLLGGIVGTLLLIFFLVQRLLKGKDSLFATNGDLAWNTPWNGEIVWQVLVVGFFFVSQIALPLLLGFLDLKPPVNDARSQANFVLFTYVISASGGIGVLYLSIKEFLPLPSGWFQFQGKNWFWWGFGGYCVALPLVLVVSLINQFIWQGQGGSNPILPIALENKDGIALLVFFLTASIAAPLYEEILFRGFLLPSLTRYFPVWGSIIISSLLFALAHLSLSEVLPLATLGMIMGFVYTRSRNILSSMLLHCLWNSGTLISLYILGSVSP